jgi:predicted glycosyltransferase
MKSEVLEVATTSEPAARSSAGNQPRAWIDLCSPSHPFFFKSLVDALEDVETTVTVREKTETVPLAAQVGFDYEVVGRDFDNPLLRMGGIPLRTATLVGRMPACDVALSSRNAMSVLAAKARGVPSIHFTDNDITAHVSGLWTEQLYNRLEASATHNVVPAAFETSELATWGNDSSSIHTYDGTKEDVSVASFEPESAFTDCLPIDDYVVVRPEALSAAYVTPDTSLVPDLLAGFVERDLPVVYLPRGRGDEVHAEPYGRSEVYVPDEPPNGLQLAWHSTCVLTGSGTMAREAAAMNKPAVSFFPNQLLSVDRRLVEQDRVFHSRNPAAVLEYVDSLTASDVDPDLARCRRVRDEVAALTGSLIQHEC